MKQTHQISTHTNIQTRGPAYRMSANCNQWNQGNKDETENTLERTELAVENWNSSREYESSTDVENKIRRIAGANLHPSAQFDNLHELFQEIYNKSQVIYNYMLTTVIPGIEKLARDMQYEKFEILGAGREGKVTISKLKIAQILANGFFCNFQTYPNLPHINFDRLYSTFGSDVQRSRSKREKLKCLLTYFKNFIADSGSKSGDVTFKRVCIHEDIFAPEKLLLQKPLTPIAIMGTGSMSDCSSNVAQVDFANKHIGGGILGNGCVQEEIKFATCPDLIGSLLVTETLQDNEALIMTGAKPYSISKGYGRDFEFVGEADLNTQCSDVIIAIDAIDFSRLNDNEGGLMAQYTEHYIKREILKAYAGFFKCPTETIATGNWGCGAFQGDPILKMKIQWIAAGMAGKKLVYYCFNDVGMAAEMTSFVQAHRDKSAGELFNLLIEPRTSSWWSKWYQYLLSPVKRAWKNFTSAHEPGGQTMLTGADHAQVIFAAGVDETATIAEESDLKVDNKPGYFW